MRNKIAIWGVTLLIIVLLAAFAPGAGSTSSRIEADGATRLSAGNSIVHGETTRSAAEFDGTTMDS